MSVMWSVLLTLCAQITSACDMYSFGVIIWEMLSGSVPWHGVSVEEMKRNVTPPPHFPLPPPPPITRHTFHSFSPYFSPVETPPTSFNIINFFKRHQLLIQILSGQRLIIPPRVPPPLRDLLLQLWGPPHHRPTAYAAGLIDMQRFFVLILIPLQRSFFDQWVLASRRTLKDSAGILFLERV
jgi:serine/threonine protein kinase